MWIVVNKKVELDVKICRYLFTAKSLYMSRPRWKEVAVPVL